AGAFPLVSSASTISSSCIPALLCLRSRFGATLTPRFGAELADGAACGLGGPGAIGITPLLPPAIPPGTLLTALETAVPPVTDPVADLGDSESPPLVLPDVGVVTGVCANEFLREAFF